MNNINPFIRNHKPFPQKLMSILSKKEFEDIISWMPEGESFSVHNKNSLSAVLRKCNLQETKFDSFRRKLHRWGFKVVKKGTKDAGAYYNKFFVRDDPTLCLNMKSRTDKTSKALALKKRDNNQAAFFDEPSRKSTESSTILNNENHAQKMRFTNYSEVKQQNNSFNQYVEMKHNDYWLKRKHLFQKYYVSFVGKAQLSPSQMNEKSSNMLRVFSDKFPSTCNVNGVMHVERKQDALEEKYGRLALKKKIKNRKDRDTKNLHHFGIGQEYIFPSNLDRSKKIVNAHAA